MAKNIKAITVQIIVSKNEAGDVDVNETAHLTVSADEYPEFEHQKGIPIVLTDTQEKAIIKHIKDVVLLQAEAAR